MFDVIKAKFQRWRKNARLDYKLRRRCRDELRKGNKLKEGPTVPLLGEFLSFTIHELNVFKNYKLILAELIKAFVMIMFVFLSVAGIVFYFRYIDLFVFPLIPFLIVIASILFAFLESACAYFSVHPKHNFKKLFHFFHHLGFKEMMSVRWTQRWDYLVRVRGDRTMFPPSYFFKIGMIGMPFFLIESGCKKIAFQKSYRFFKKAPWQLSLLLSQRRNISRLIYAFALLMIVSSLSFENGGLWAIISVAFLVGAISVNNVLYKTYIYHLRLKLYPR